MKSIQFWRWQLCKDIEGRAWPVPSEPSILLRDGLTINGVSFHVYAIRVADGDVQDAYNPEFDDELSAVQALSCGRVQQTRLPGLQGSWVIVVHPFQD